jgi:hypothetical protein
MKSKLKTLALGAFMVGSLVLSSSAAMARDYDHWSRHDSRWSNQYDRRQDYEALAQWRAKLDYDARHHASRKKLAEDQAQIQALEERLGLNGRGYGWHR